LLRSNHKNKLFPDCAKLGPLFKL